MAKEDKQVKKAPKKTEYKSGTVQHVTKDGRVVELPAAYVAHQFGKKDGNPQGVQSHAASMRAFYAWLSQASDAEARAFCKDETKPIVMRMYAQKLLKEGSIKDFHDFTEQIAGKPKQVLEFQNLPELHCEAFGDDD